MLDISDLLNCYTKARFCHHFSTNFSLAIDDLSEMRIALNDVTHWYTLGIHLKLKVPTLGRIQGDFRDGRRAKEEMLKPWEVLVKALRIMGEN